MEATEDTVSIINSFRDSIYIAVVILGIGTGMTAVTCNAIVADLVGEHTVSRVAQTVCLLLTEYTLARLLEVDPEFGLFLGNTVYIYLPVGGWDVQE